MEGSIVIAAKLIGAGLAMIGAIGAGETLANLFGVRRGAPCLGIHRATNHRDVPLTTVTLTSPAGRFVLEGGYAPIGDLS